MAKQTPGKNFVHQKGMIEPYMTGHIKNELDPSYPNCCQSYTIKTFLFELAPGFYKEMELLGYIFTLYIH